MYPQIHLTPLPRSWHSRILAVHTAAWNFPASLAVRCDHVTKFLTLRYEQLCYMAASGNFPQKTDGTYLAPLLYSFLHPQHRCDGCHHLGPWGPGPHQRNEKAVRWAWVLEDTVEQLRIFYLRTLIREKNKLYCLNHFHRVSVSYSQY